MRKPICIQLLISSPNDVRRERDLIEEVCRNWNDSVGQEKNVSIECVRWEKHLSINSNIKSQQLINEQLVEKCDILVAVFGKRFGTPTDTHSSGTIEEIEQIIAAGKPHFIYFIQRQYKIDDMETEQIQQIKNFKAKLAFSGSFKEIKKIQDLREQFYNDINYNINKLLSSNNTSIKSEVVADKTEVKSNKANWYELSISESINKFLEKKSQKFAAYKRGVTFIENCSLWNSVQGVNHKVFMDTAKSAREHAFDLKYGNYDYSKDLRSLYPNWHEEIRRVLIKKDLTKNINVIGVASNYGEELKQIFSDTIFSETHLSVLEISDSAIKKGEKAYKDIEFIRGNMEESPLKSSEYDVYFNLRSIHSSGVDFRSALSECYRVLKPGGIAIISVSNGYLTPKKPNSNEMFEIQGLYDNRTETFSKHRPYELSRKICSKLIDYGYKNPEIFTGKTEIFIVAQR